MFKELIDKLFTKLVNYNYGDYKENKQNEVIRLAKKYAEKELIEVKPLVIDTVKKFTVEEIQLKKKENDKLIQDNKKMIVEIGNLRAQMRTDNEEEADLYSKLSEKLHRLIENANELSRYESAYVIHYTALVGFRKKEYEYLLREYAEEGTSFWKFSQSRAGIAGEAGVFAEYIPGQITESEDKDSLLSFVRAKDLYKCWQYGDQITKFIFDLKDERFDTIAEKPAYETGNGLGEIKSDYLLTENNYSLSKIETIITIINISGENKMNAVWTIFTMPLFREQMNKFGFDETVLFIDYVKKRASISEDPVFWICQNICALYDDYIKENSK